MPGNEGVGTAFHLVYNVYCVILLTAIIVLLPMVCNKSCKSSFVQLLAITHISTVVTRVARVRYHTCTNYLDCVVVSVVPV